MFLNHHFAHIIPTHLKQIKLKRKKKKKSLHFHLLLNLLASCCCLLLSTAANTFSVFPLINCSLKLSMFLALLYFLPFTVHAPPDLFPPPTQQTCKGKVGKSAFFWGKSPLWERMLRFKEWISGFRERQYCGRRAFACVSSVDLGSGPSSTLNQLLIPWAGLYYGSFQWTWNLKHFNSY